jgi:hypothetical protein
MPGRRSITDSGEAARTGDVLPAAVECADLGDAPRVSATGDLPVENVGR